MTEAIKNLPPQVIISGVSTAGSIAGLLMAKKYGWDKTMSFAVGGFAGLIVGVGIGIIQHEKK